MAGHDRVNLALSDGLDTPAQVAPWAGNLVALGGMARRFQAQAPDRQLVITLSVPRRHFAATLIGCGWVISRPRPNRTPPLPTLRNATPGDRIRIVTKQEIAIDRFVELRDSSESTVVLANSKWLASSIEATAYTDSTQEPVRSRRYGTGALAQWAGVSTDWAHRLAAPVNDLAFIGTKAWLHEDMQGGVQLHAVQHSANPSRGDLIEALLMPDTIGAATSFSRVYAAARFEEFLPLANRPDCAILDGTGAIRYLAEIESPVVICVLDRSVADDSAAELLVQIRNTRGEPISLQEQLGWRAPAGIAAVGFTVTL